MSKRADLLDYQERVVEERRALEVKREKLGAFKNTNVFAGLPWREQEMLNTQGHLMTALSAVLAMRIMSFGADAQSSVVDESAPALGAGPRAA